MSPCVKLLAFGVLVIISSIIILWMSWVKGRRLYWKVIATIVSPVLLAGGWFLIRAGLDAPREMALQATEARLSVLSVALADFWQEYGKYPDHLGVLVSSNGIPERIIRSPFQADPSKNECDYIYVLDLKHDDPEKWPIAFDVPGFHKDGTRSVVLLSGDVRTCSQKDFEELLEMFCDEYEQNRGKEPTLVYECPVTQ